jgi:hypothetical protein
MEGRPTLRRSIAALGDVTHFVVSCPKDTIMYTAAVQALGVEDKIKVYDIIDLVVMVDKKPASPEQSESATVIV